MNKIVFIGDIHGHDTWKPIVSKHKDADHFVFVGDYFDAFLITPAVQIQNFKDIIKFKESNPDNVTLLIGNHDFHYMPWCRGQYGGYSHFFATEIWELLKKNMHNLEAAWQYNNVLVTHAGTSKTWYFEHTPEPGNMFELADKINLLWAERPDLFNHSGKEIRGNSPMMDLFGLGRLLFVRIRLTQKSFKSLDTLRENRFQMQIMYFVLILYPESF